jgi:hypothetical protein
MIFVQYYLLLYMYLYVPELGTYGDLLIGRKFTYHMERFSINQRTWQIGQKCIHPTLAVPYYNRDISTSGTCAHSSPLFVFMVCVR